jgi:type I restriction enzyme S subunit
LFHYLNNDRVKKSHIRPYVTQSTISGINQSNLAQVPVLHPPLELQQKFGARVQSIENVTRTQVNSLAELDTLFASLQHRAFRGDL